MGGPGPTAAARRLSGMGLDGIGMRLEWGDSACTSQQAQHLPAPPRAADLPPSFFLPRSIRRRGCGEAGARRAGKRATLHLLCPTLPFSALPERNAKAALANGGEETRTEATPGPMQCHHFWHDLGKPFPTPACPENTARSEDSLP